MPQRDRKPKPDPPGDGWFVYMVRCADGPLYTGVAKDVARRCRQHNAGTASRYTRTRRPVELAYQEPHPDHSSALRREAAIKAMDWREKLRMAKQRKTPAKGARQVARLEDIPNVGPAVAADLRRLGITTPAGLPGRDPYGMYDDLCRITGHRHDPCVLDTFIAAVRYVRGRRSGRGGRTRRSGSGRWRPERGRVSNPGTTMPSLCETCGHVREVRTARSRFLLCGLSLTTAAYPKYPPQPVVRCDGYRTRNDADDGEPGARCEEG